MIKETILMALTGFGLLFFSLRFLTNALDVTLSRRLRPYVNRFTAHGYQSFFLGTTITLVVQASSITIIATMGLLNRSLITLEQAILITLGAALGSALKSFFMVQYLDVLGPLLIVGSSFLYFFAKSSWKKKLCEACLAIGISFLGVHLIEKGLSPLIYAPIIKDHLDFINGSGFFKTLFATISGLFLSTLVQSSSSVVAIALDLSNQGLMTLAALGAIVLGANIGTTSTVALASIGQSVNARRLALGYVLTKTLAVGFVLIFFNMHMYVITKIGTLFSLSVKDQVALIHVLFNLMNGLFWWLFLPILARTLRFILQERELDIALPFSEKIRKILFTMPQRAQKDFSKELSERLRGLYWISEGIYHVLFFEKDFKKQTAYMAKLRDRCGRLDLEIENLKQTLTEYLISTQGNDALSKAAHHQLFQTVTISQVFEILEALVYRIDSEIIELGFQFSEAEMSLMENSRERSHKVWEDVYTVLKQEPPAPLVEASEEMVPKLNEGTFLLEDIVIRLGIAEDTLRRVSAQKKSDESVTEIPDKATDEVFQLRFAHNVE